MLTRPVPRNSAGASLVLRNFLYAWLVLVSISSTARGIEPQWIWNDPAAGTKAAAGKVYFRREFELPKLRSASAIITADNRFQLIVNGTSVASGDSWNQLNQVDLTKHLQVGVNVVAIEAGNDGADPAGLVFKLTATPESGEPVEIVSDAGFSCTDRPSRGWAAPKFEAPGWKPAAVLGGFGKIAPWGAVSAIVPVTAEAPAKAAHREEGHFQFRDGDRVVLLGGTFIERMQTCDFFEAIVTTALPHLNLKFRNLGWSGDTVWGDSRGVFGSRSDGFKRLLGDVKIANPTVILVAYGENEAYEGAAGLSDFEAGLETLLSELEKTGARIVLVAPRKHEVPPSGAPSPENYNADLVTYAAAMQAIARERGAAYVSLLDANPGEKLTENGLHFTFAGQLAIGRSLAKQLGVPVVDRSIEISATPRTLHAQGLSLSEVQIAPEKVAMKVTERMLPLVAASTWRSGIVTAEPGIDPKPEELTPTTLTIKGLAAGRYRVTLGGKETSQFSSDELSRGVKLVDPDTFAQSYGMLATMRQKNELFFHRHRPQNETYLFLFRKHEQGNNAVEIPQFDPLIEESEAAIRSQLAPRTRDLVIEAISPAGK